MAKNLDDVTLHCGATRMRITGSGTFKQTLSCLDNTASEVMPTLAMSSTPGKEIITLSGFIADRICLRGEVTDIDEWFNISKITIYVKPIATGYPL